MLWAEWAKVCSLGSHSSSGLEQMTKAGLPCPCRALSDRRVLWLKKGLWRVRAQKEGLAWEEEAGKKI